jgi:hypothetical protein
MLKSKRNLVVTIAAGMLASCSISSAPDKPLEVMTQKDFASGGKIEMQLEGGNYEIRPAAGDQIRVSFKGNYEGATSDVTTNGTQATIAVKNTPHRNFNAIIEVPKTADVTVHLAAGNLEMAAITGNKNIESGAGNMEIAVGNSQDYASVDASNKAGNIDANPFGKSESGVMKHITWSGPGKYTLRVDLGAGNLELK